MRENKVIGWISLALFAAALGVMLALFAVAGLGLDKSIEKYITINVDLVLLAVSLLALIASVLGFLALKTIQGKMGAVGGLILFLVAAGMFAMKAKPVNAEQVGPPTAGSAGAPPASVT